MDTEISEILKRLENKVDNGFDRLESKVDGLEVKVNGIEAKLDELLGFYSN